MRWPARWATPIAALIVALAAFTPTAAAVATESQPVAFVRDIPRGIYQVTSVDMPEVPWERFTIALNWTAPLPLDVLIMRCNDTDRFEQKQPFEPLYVGAGATGNAHASVLARNYTEPDLCIVLDNTDLGATPAASGAEGDPLHVSVEGVQAIGPESGALEASPGGGSNVALSIVLALLVIGGLGAVIVIGHRRRPKEIHAIQQLPPGEQRPPPGYP